MFVTGEFGVVDLLSDMISGLMIVFNGAIEAVEGANISEGQQTKDVNTKSNGVKQK